MKMKVVFLIVTLAALPFLLIPSISIYRSVAIKNHGIAVEGTIIGKRTQGKSLLSKVTVSFVTPDGNQVSATAARRGFVRTGDRVKLWYDPASPQEIDFGDTIGYNLRGAILGGILFILGIIFSIYYAVKDMANKKLQRYGKKVNAEFVSIDRNEKYRMGANNPWVIKCRWVDDQNHHEYYYLSRDYIIDPAPYMAGLSHVDVFVDPADPNTYYMDTSFMPKGNITIG